MKSLQLKSNNQGFTLVEILVVITIVSILSAVVAVGSIQSGQKSRDAKRQADLQILQSAIELFKSKYGAYPEGCNGPDVWAGQLGTNYACTNGSTQYITVLAPEFIPVLPADKKLNGANSGYVYRVNAERTVYKLKAHRTVESEIVDYTHKFKACDIRVASDASSGSLLSGSQDREVIGWCGRVHPSNSLPAACRYTDVEWRSSYAVWGGFMAKRTLPVDVCGAQINCRPAVVQDTTTVICM